MERRTDKLKPIPHCVMGHNDTFHDSTDDITLSRLINKEKIIIKIYIIFKNNLSNHRTSIILFCVSGGTERSDVIDMKRKTVKLIPTPIVFIEHNTTIHPIP